MKELGRLQHHQAILDIEELGKPKWMTL